MELDVYIRIAEALETLDSDGDGMGCKTIAGVSAISERISALRAPLSAIEVAVATQLVRGHMTVEVPGRHSSEVLDGAPEALTLPDPRLLEDYITAPYKHVCKAIKMRRHAKQAFRVLSSVNPVRQSLMRATVG
jgi:hypothetical protein